MNVANGASIVKVLIWMGTGVGGVVGGGIATGALVSIGCRVPVLSGRDAMTVYVPVYPAGNVQMPINLTGTLYCAATAAGILKVTGSVEPSPSSRGMLVHMFSSLLAGATLPAVLRVSNAGVPDIETTTKAILWHWYQVFKGMENSRQSTQVIEKRKCTLEVLCREGLDLEFINPSGLRCVLRVPMA